MGNSVTAYHIAKERLERKFCGHHCQIALYLEEVDNFRPVCPSNYNEIEKFADLLDITIVNLKEANHSEELNDSLLYLKPSCYLYHEKSLMIKYSRMPREVTDD